MQTQKITLAAMLLVTLGVTGCSISTGGGSQGVSPIPQRSAVSNTTANSNTVAGTSSTNGTNSTGSTGTTTANSSNSAETSTPAATDKVTENTSNTNSGNATESSKPTTNTAATTDNSGNSNSGTDTAATDSSNNTEAKPSEGNSDATNMPSDIANNNTDNITDNTTKEPEVLTYPNVVNTSLGEQATKLMTADGQKVLQEKLATISNVESGNCVAACNATNVQTGEVVKAFRTSYANYAVVREAYDRENRATPTNSYIATVTTPTTDKAAVVDATYKGQASWSSANRFNIRTVAGLTLTVANDKISGEVKQDTPTSSGEYPTLITFNSGNIAANSNGAIGFKGTATFSARAFSTEQAGTYQGYFAGDKAEEVIGTFQSDTQTSDAAAQGAFSAIKQ